MRERHNRHDRRPQRDDERGIPDGLLVGLLGFVLGLTLLVWTATGLAGVLSHGAWPAGVTFGNTPPAMRALASEPHDLASAWPNTPKAELSGYGLFWGLAIGELMVLVVLTVFVLGTLARWRAVRARAGAHVPTEARESLHTKRESLRTKKGAPGRNRRAPARPRTEQRAAEWDFPTAPEPGTTADRDAATGMSAGAGADGGYRSEGRRPGHPQDAAPDPAHTGDSPRQPRTADHGASERDRHDAYGPSISAGPHPLGEPLAEQGASGWDLNDTHGSVHPADPAHPGPYTAPAGHPQLADRGAGRGLHSAHGAHRPATHGPGTHADSATAGPHPLAGQGASARDPLGSHPAVPAPRAPRVLYGDPATRRPATVQAVLDAEGPALVVTSDPTVWAETKDARAKLGPVLVYDPGHLCDTPARLHWSPTAHCEDPARAQERAHALLAPVRPRALLDAAMADTAETLLHCWLHAAAVDGRPFKQLHRWAQGGSAHDAVRILRTHPKATAGLAGLLESALTAHPERREIAQQLVVRALSALSSVHIREACTPNRTDSLILESFVNEGGTLYVVGEPIEDPRAHPGAMPLLTALASDVVERGRRMAARSSDGRLDPPMTLVLDDVAAVAPLPRLPELLATGQDHGLPALVLLRSAEQARARWSEALNQ
ncbi:type VI secretion protein [Streptomyces sp. NBC_01142]|uniref:type IV secretory system conjugative DNA transfer family protein n=1 Tax=Streptomyces sp. NBC_01142 TaxID=2975865 RepID=UPI002258C685|nr:type VI secretion protein [Streptomyces sp. NBC_01142]MCX4824106.1 type VI secretion protein [Streptomyces sp. NBC_01142]